MKSTIVERFEDAVIQYKDQIAVLFRDWSLSFFELNRSANKVAWELKAKGIGPDSIVGLMAERSLERIVGILGILKAGGAYLPLSSNYPENRILELIEDSQISLLLTIRKHAHKYDFPVETLIVEEILDKNLSTHNPPLKPEPDHLAYVIYTSGSTGSPKGVLIEHGALMNRLQWMQDKYPIGTKDTLLQKTPYTFDVSVWELLWWTFTGAKLCLLPSGTERLPMAVMHSVEIQKVTTIHFVPSMLGVFLHYSIETEQSNRLASLKRLFCSGEALKNIHVRKFKAALADPYQTQMINLYGPTEATIDVTYYNIDVENIPDQIPIGKAIEGVKTYIVNENQILDNGGIGELWLSGICIGRGYLNRPHLTEKQFRSRLIPGNEIVYKTGDLVQQNSDGNIEFLGRIDHQIKIHGIRIELGEIEAVLTSHPDVLDGVVLLRIYHENVKILVAYVVAFSLDKKDLKDFMLTKLPEYMVPKEYIFLEELPLNKNGKTDRKSLPALVF